MKKVLFERLLIGFSFAVFFILVAVQAAMTHPGIKSVFFYEQIEGSPLSSEVYLYAPCKMELRLVNMGQCPELKVLVNGDEVDFFTGKTVMLDLKDGDIVQLDGCNVPVQAQVQISAVSRNITSLLGKSVVVKNGILTIANISASEK